MPPVAAPWMASCPARPMVLSAGSGSHQQAQRRGDRIRQQIGGGGRPTNQLPRAGQWSAPIWLNSRPPLATAGRLPCAFSQASSVGFSHWHTNVSTIDIDAGDQVDPLMREPCAPVSIRSRTPRSTPESKFDWSGRSLPAGGGGVVRTRGDRRSADRGSFSTIGSECRLVAARTMTGWRSERRQSRR